MDAVDRIGVAGTAMGGFGLFVQLFDKCTHAFSLWRESEGIGTDAIAFRVRLDMQAARLKEWGLNWEIGAGPRALYLFEPRFKTHGDLAVEYVATLNHLLNILNLSVSENAALVSGSNFPISAATHIARLGELEDQDSLGRSLLTNKINNIRNEATAIQRLGWSSDDGKATKSLSLIKSMIDELYDFFPPPRRDVAAHIVFNSCLASLNLDVLNKIKDTSPEDPLLSGIAYLKITTSKLRSRSSALDYVSIGKKLRLFKESQKADPRSNRSLGTFEAEDVIVEWKEMPRQMGTRNQHLTIATVAQRVENVGRLLKHDLKPPELRTLDCVGVITRTEKRAADISYGLMFRKPGREYRTLLDIINDPAAPFDLGQRFSVAQKLAESILFLHLSGWLHKGIRSDNVLFFGQTRSAVDVDAPYIAGFEYSRESGANHATEGVLDDLEFNLYRHSDVQGLPEESPGGEDPPQSQLARPPFSRKHDVYALGVILLEIGLLKSAFDMYKDAEDDDEYSIHSAEQFSRRLIQKEVPKLSRLVGTTYRDATLRCLDGSFLKDDKATTETGMYINVIRALASCNA